MEYELAIEVLSNNYSIIVILPENELDRKKTLTNIMDKINAMKEVVPKSLIYNPQTTKPIGNRAQPTMEDTWEISIKEGANPAQVLENIKEFIGKGKFYESIK